MAGTKDFNLLDLVICRWRSRIVARHIDAGSKLLDFGCGHQALFLRSVADRLTQGVGLDYDAEPQQIGANLEIRNERFVDRLQFETASLDCVTMLAVLEHIPLDEIDVLIAEIRRVLKPGGRLLLTTPTPRSQPVLEFLAFKLHIISEPEIADHKHYYSQADIAALAERNQLRFGVFQTFQAGLNCFALLEKPRDA